MRVGSRVNAIDSLGCNHHRRVEAKRRIGPVNVVVDRLGNAHTGHAVLAQIKRHRLRVVSAQRNQRIDLVELQNFLDLFDTAGNLLHVGSG